MTTRLALLEAVQRWLHRTNDTDLVADLSTMLRNVEARFAREVLHSSMEQTTQITALGRTATLPDDCLYARSLSLAAGTYRKLDQVNAEVLREGYWWTAGGSPRFFNISNRTVYLAPVADATTGTLLDLVYFARFPALVNDADTNYLLTNFFDLYLYAMLAEAARYIQDQEAMVGFEAQLADIKRNLEGQDYSYQRSGSVRRRIGSSYRV